MRVETGSCRVLAALLFVMGMSHPAWGQRTGNTSEARALLSEAQTLAKQGKIKAAIERYQGAIKRNPMLTEAYEGYANALFVLRRHKEGVAVASRGLQQEPNNEPLQGQLGMHLYSLGKTKEAFRYLHKVLASQSQRFEIMAAAGQCCLRMQDSRCAVKALQNYLKHRPGRLKAKDGAFRVLLGRAHVDNDEPREALKQIEAVLRATPSNRAARAVQARAQLKLKQCGRAIATLQRLKAELPGQRFASLRLSLGQAYFCGKRYREALRAAKTHLKAAPNDADGLLLRADANARLRRYKQALGTYRKLLTREESSAVRARVAGVLFAQRRYKLVLKEVELALAKGKPEADPLTLGLRAALRSKQKPRAMQYAVRLLALPSQSADALVYAGMAHSSLGKFDQALALQHKALKIDDKHRVAKAEIVKVVSYLARAAYRNNDLPAALARLRRAAKIAPRSLVLNRNLALCLLKQGKHAEALVYLKKFLKRIPRDSVANRLAARALVGLKRPKQALIRLELAVASVYRHGGVALAQVLGESALVRFKLGQVKAAVSELERALELSGGESGRKLASSIRVNLARVHAARVYKLLGSAKPKRILAGVKKLRPLLASLPAEERAVGQIVALLGVVAAGRSEEGKVLLRQMTLKRKQRGLRAPYDKLGKPFLAAYLDLASPSDKVREQAATKLSKLARRLPAGERKRVSSLAADALQRTVVGFFRRGKLKDAQKAMARARKLNPGKSAKWRHNMAVLGYRGRNKASAAATLKGVRKAVPLAACNLAVHHEGKREMVRAYQLFRECEQRGGAYPDLKRIIATKQRIHGEVPK